MVDAPLAPAPGVAPFILERVGDVGRPRAALPLTADLSHLPGRTDAWTGLRTLIGTARYGVEHQIEQGRRYGPVFAGAIGRTPMVFVLDADHVGEIARNPDGAWSSALAWRHWHEGLDPGKRTYDSLVGLDFEPHRDARRWIRPAFSSDAIASYVRRSKEAFVPAIEEAIERGGCRFKPTARAVFAELADRIFLGIDDPARARTLDDAMAHLWNAPMALAKDPRWSPTWRRALRGRRVVFEGLRERVPRRREGTGADLFSRLCKAESPPDWLDDDALVAVLIGILGAAFDTAAMGVTSLIYLLATHPTWQERLREEARGVDPDTVDPGALRSLTEHDAAWRESLRLYPVANGLPRRALRDVELGAHRVPAGAFVSALLGPSMRDPARWTAPGVFDPTRFAPERAEHTRERSGYLPYGAGAHACVGARLSTLQAITFLHAMLTRCRFRLARPYVARHGFGPLGVVSGDVALTVERL